MRDDGNDQDDNDNDHRNDDAYFLFILFTSHYVQTANIE